MTITKWNQSWLHERVLTVISKLFFQHYNAITGILMIVWFSLNIFWNQRHLIDSHTFSSYSSVDCKSSGMFVKSNSKMKEFVKWLLKFTTLTTLIILVSMCLLFQLSSISCFSFLFLSLVKYYFLLSYLQNADAFDGCESLHIANRRLILITNRGVYR